MNEATSVHDLNLTSCALCLILESRKTELMLQTGGVEKLILLKYAHFGMYLEVLIECGAFIYSVYR